MHAYFKTEILGPKPAPAVEIRPRYQLGLKEGCFKSGTFSQRCRLLSDLYPWDPASIQFSMYSMLSQLWWPGHIPESYIRSIPGDLALNSFFSASTYQLCKVDGLLWSLFSVILAAFYLWRWPALSSFSFTSPNMISMQEGSIDCASYSKPLNFTQSQAFRVNLCHIILVILVCCMSRRVCLSSLNVFQSSICLNGLRGKSQHIRQKLGIIQRTLQEFFFFF